MLSKTMNFVECLLFIPSADLGNNGLDRDDLICDYDVFPPKLKWDKFHDYGPTAMFSVQKWYICHIDVFYLKKKDDRIPSQIDQHENISPCLSGRGDAFLSHVILLSQLIHQIKQTLMSKHNNNTSVILQKHRRWIPVTEH